MTERRALHLIDHFALGGAQRIIATLLEYRPQDLVFPVRHKSPQMTLPPHKVHNRGSATYLSFITSLPNLLRVVRQEDVRVLHCHLPGSWMMALLVAAVFRRTDLAFVFHEHGEILFRRRWYRWLAGLAAKHGVIVANSEQVTRRVEASGVPPDRTAVLYGMVDINHFVPDTQLGAALRSRLGYQYDDFLVGFAGRLVPRKGWRQLLHALETLEEHAHIKLLIAGDGPDEEKLLAEASRLGLGDRVHLLGYVEDMKDFFNAVDVFAMPSLVEPLGIVQTEAQACGTPVVGYDVPGVNETLDSSNAIMLPAGDVQGLADGILHLKRDANLYQRLAGAGVQNARRFSAERYIAQLSTIYTSLLEESST